MLVVDRVAPSPNFTRIAISGALTPSAVNLAMRAERGTVEAVSNTASTSAREADDRHIGALDVDADELVAGSNIVEAQVFSRLCGGEEQTSRESRRPNRHSAAVAESHVEALHHGTAIPGVDRNRFAGHRRVRACHGGERGVDAAFAPIFDAGMSRENEAGHAGHGRYELTGPFHCDISRPLPVDFSRCFPTRFKRI